MSKKEKPIRKDLTFDELSSLVIGFGYDKIEGKGFAVKFYNKKEDNLINLHKPHPSNLLKMCLVRQIQVKLKEIM